MSKDFINWGIISCARIADRALIPGIKGSFNSRLYAISGKTREKLEEFKKKHNPVKAYDNYEDILNDPDVDAVYIPLPNSMHIEWVFKAAEKKKHVLCEKPLGCTPDEVLQMKEAAEKNGIILMEAFAYRQNPLIFKVKELIDTGAVGELRLLEGYFSFYLSDPDDIRFNRDLRGGATYDIGCYAINVIRYLAGEEPSSVFAVGEAGIKSGVDESSCGIMEFSKGLKGIFSCTFKAPFRSGFRVVGESGIIETSAWFHATGDLELTIKRDSGVEVITVNSPDNYVLEATHFSNCILKGEKPLISLEDSYNNAVVIDKVLKQVLK